MLQGVLYLLIAVILTIGASFSFKVGFEKIGLARHQAKEQTITQAKKVNFYKTLQNKLNNIFYSYYTLKNLPAFPEKNDENGLIFAKEVFQLRKFRLRIENRFYLFYPLKREDEDRSFNKISFFIIEDIRIDKSLLHQTFQNADELDLAFQIIEDGEYAINAFMTFWNSLPDGNPYKVNLELDKSKLSKFDIDRAKVRWHKAEEIYRHVSNIEKNIEKLKENFTSPLEIKQFTSENVSTIGKYKYKIE